MSEGGWLKGPGGGSHNRPSSRGETANQYRAFKDRKPEEDETDAEYLNDLAKKMEEKGGVTLKTS